MAQKSEVPGWVKALVYVTVPIAAIYLVYRVVSDFLFGPLNSLKDLWKEQYSEYLKEVKQYNDQTNGNITSEQWKILDNKMKMMQQTEASIVQLANRIYDLAAMLVTLAIGVWAAVKIFGPAIQAKWANYLQGNAGTSRGYGYIAVCGLVDDLAANGQLTNASVLKTSMMNQFQTVTLPEMTADLAYFQQQVTLTTGWEYLYCLYMIQWLQVEMVSIPAAFSMLPPLP